MLDEIDLAIDTEVMASRPGSLEQARRQSPRLPGVQVLPLVAADEGSDAPANLTGAWLAAADGDDQLLALQAGAAGVVSANARAGEIAAAMAALRAGHAVLPPDLLRELVPAGRSDSASDGPSLTPREESVLKLLSEGATNKMIARRLDISVHTAKFHVASILDKLDATTRTDAVAQGVRQGVLML